MEGLGEWELEELYFQVTRRNLRISSKKPPAFLYLFFFPCPLQFLETAIISLPYSLIPSCINPAFS